MIFGDPEYKGYVQQVFLVIVRSHQGVDEKWMGEQLTKNNSLTVLVQGEEQSDATSAG